MADRDKVIIGLEELRRYADNEIHPVVSPDNWIVYSRLIDLIEETENNVHALLKAQEPVKPLKMEVEHVRKKPVVFSYQCPVCMCGLQRHWVACPICGTGVKLE